MVQVDSTPKWDCPLERPVSNLGISSGGELNNAELLAGLSSRQSRLKTQTIHGSDVGGVGYPWGGAGGGSLSLVTPTHNSSNASYGLARCPKPTLLLGRCVAHNQRHYMEVPCKRRDCDYCGPAGRRRLAERIAWGVRQIELAGGRCAWLVLTWAYDVEKDVAVRQVNNFVKWLRKRMPGLELAKTWETTKQGRLHCNVVAGPWVYVSQRELQERWGARVWVAYVRDSGGVGREVAKAYSPESLGSYLSKLDQAVKDGRRAGFSRGWPRVPVAPAAHRKGRILWGPLGILDLMDFRDESCQGSLVEVRPGEYARLRDIPWCDCFDLVLQSWYDSPTVVIAWGREVLCEWP